MRARVAVLVAAVVCLAGGSMATAAPKPPPAKMTVSPTTATSGVQTTLAFKYQATAAFTAKPVTLTVPTGWTPPVTSPSFANGYVSITKGTCTTAGSPSVSGSGPWTITFPSVTCGTNKQFTITYARTTPTTTGARTFTSVVNALAAGPVVVTVAPGSAAKLVVTQQPAGALGGSAFTTQPKVSITDAGGNVVTSSTAPVTLTLVGGTAGAALTCTTNPRTAVSGVATFAGCKVDKVGTGYTLHATSGSLASTDSAAFDVTPGPAVSLAFTVQPTATIVSGTAFSPPPEVTVYDAGGNVALPSVVYVTLDPTSGVGGFSGCPPQNGSVVTVSCTWHGLGSGLRLLARDLVTGATATSDPFDGVALDAVRLVFNQQPDAGTGGVAFSNQPIVSAVDDYGNVDSNYAGPVTLTATGGTGTLSGCTQSTSAGVVTFSGCAIDTAGTYQLHVEDGALIPDDTFEFNVDVGPAAAISLALDPSTIESNGSSIATATVTDAGGNPVAGETGVTIDALGTGTESDVTDNGDGTYSATVSALLAGPYTVEASLGALTDQATLTVVAAAPDTIDLVLDPATIAAGEGSLAVVYVYDVSGNPVLGLTTVTISGDTTPGPVHDNEDGSYQAALSPTAAGSYTITAELGVLSDSETLVVNPAAGTHVDLVLDPSTVSADIGMSTATVTVTDDLGNPVDGEIVTITGDATIGTVTPLGSGQYSATVESHAAGEHDITATNGTDSDIETLSVTPGAAYGITLALSPDTVAAGEESTATVTLSDFYGNPVPGQTVGIESDLSVSLGSSTMTDNADGTYSTSVSSTQASPHDVVASLDAYNSDTETLTVTAGAATHLWFSTEPQTAPFICFTYGYPIPCFFLGIEPTVTGEAFPTQPVVRVLDAYNNTVVSDDTTAVTLSITDGYEPPGGATLTCDTNPVTVVDGIASFSGCSIDKPSEGYRLTAEAAGLSGVDSDVFLVVQRPPTTIDLALDPDTITADGVDYSTATITLTDSLGNPVPNWNPTLSAPGLSVSTVFDNGDGTYTATLSGTVTGAYGVSATAGTTGFSSIGDDATLTLAAGPPAVLSYLSGDSQTVTVGNAAGDSLCVNVVDDYYNVAPGVSVDYAVLSGSGAGASVDTPVSTDEFGNACAGLTANTVAGVYTVRASISGVGSYDFTITNAPGAPASFVDKSGDNQYANPGFQYYWPLEVTLVDQYANPIPGEVVTFTAGAATFSDPAPVTDTNGRVSVTATASSGPYGEFTVTATSGAAYTEFTLIVDS